MVVSYLLSLLIPVKQFIVHRYYSSDLIIVPTVNIYIGAKAFYVDTRIRWNVLLLSVKSVETI